MKKKRGGFKLRSITEICTNVDDVMSICLLCAKYNKEVVNFYCKFDVRLSTRSQKHRIRFESFSRSVTGKIPSDRLRECPCP